MLRSAITVLLLALWGAPAAAEQESPPPEPPTGDELEARLRRLTGEAAKLREADEALQESLEEIQADLEFVEQRVEQLMPLTGRLTGWLDFGFFAVQGDGSGIRSDIGNVVFPEFAGVVPDSWVFLGDPLSTTINARGEPADTGESRAITFDSVDSGGQPTFIINSLSLALFAGIGDDLTLNGLFDLVPRGRDVSNPDGLHTGDFVDVKLAYVEYLAPVDSFALSLFAGKFDSVVGFEYRSQEAPDRLTVTPSLLCRYVCGHPLGLKARARLLDEALVVNVAITNGSHFSESFPFHDEIDSNRWKTVAGRLSYKLAFGLELGASGAFGAQDLQPEDDVYQWHAGGDLHLERDDLELTAEYVKGSAPGEDSPGEAPCGIAPCLDYQAAYGLVGYRVNNWLIPYVRVDWRDATHQAGASFVYISELARATAGVRLELGTNVVVKAEYTANRELGDLPQFRNDVFTSAMIVKY